MSTNITYHVGGFNPSAPAQNKAEQWTNATQPTDPTPAGYTAWDTSGNVTAQRALTTDEANMLAVSDQAQTAAANSANAASSLSALLSNMSADMQQGQTDLSTVQGLTSSDPTVATLLPIIARMIQREMDLANGINDLLTWQQLNPNG